MQRVKSVRWRVLVLAALSVALVSAWPLAGEDRPARANTGNLLKEVNNRVEAEAGDLETLYKHLHANPELSLQEFRTAGKMAEELKKLGFKVTTKFGATGVVGVFENGKGPVVLVRTDMDALPVTERTGLPYASKVRVRDKAGQEVGVMHACGHDMHMTCWVGTARVLVAFKDRWQGSLNTLRGEEDIAKKIDVKPENCFEGFDAYKKVLESGIDVVLLTTPPGFRPLHLRAAVEAGKHIFCEKPMAVDGRACTPSWNRPARPRRKTSPWWQASATATSTPSAKS